MVPFGSFSPLLLLMQHSILCHCFQHYITIIRGNYDQKLFTCLRHRSFSISLKFKTISNTAATLSFFRCTTPKTTTLKCLNVFCMSMMCKCTILSSFPIHFDDKGKDSAEIQRIKFVQMVRFSSSAESHMNVRSNQKV